MKRCQRKRRRALGVASGVFVFIVAIVMLVALPVAHADEPLTAEQIRDHEEQARAAVRRGLAAFARGDAQAALDEYKRAEALVPDANVPYRYAAEALVQLGRTDEAIESLEKYLSFKQDVSDGDTVRARIAALRASRPSKVVIECDAPNVSITIDRAPADPRECPAAIAVAPGPHAVTISAVGYEPGNRTFVAVAGKPLRVAIHLAKTMPAAERAPDARGGSPWRTIGWTALGVGGALVVTGAVFDLALLGPALDDLHAAAARGDAHSADLQSHARTYRTLGLVGYAAGAAFAVTGAVLVLTTPHGSVSASVSPGVGAVTGTLRF